MPIDPDEYQRYLKQARNERDTRRERLGGNLAQRAYRDRNPIRHRCQKAVLNALRSGRLVKPSMCENCGEAAPVLDAHHDDYSKPLEVRWLCRQCHKDWHAENGPGLNGDEEEFDVGMLDRFEKFADKTFNDAADEYLAEFDGKCRRRQEYALEPIRKYIGHLPLIDVDDQALKTYKEERRKEVMVGTVNKELTAATTVLRRAAQVWRWIPSAPKLQRLKGDSRKAYPITWDEQIAVFSRLVGNLQKICLFAVNTGVRREEVFKLKWADERDIDGVMVFILRDTKNGQDRPVVCNSIARRVVDHMRQPTGDKNFPRSDVYVFPRMTVNKVFNLAWDEAGLPRDPLIKKGVHNLRHTFGYRLRQAGVPAEDRDALLGHHNRSLTQHYAVPDIKRLAELAERVTVRSDTAVLR